MMKHKFRTLIIFFMMIILFNASACPVHADKRYSFYFGYDFTSATPGKKPSGISLNTKADCNTVGVVADGGLDGNCMQIFKSGTDGDPYFDISVSNYYSEVPAVLKFSFITPEITSSKHVTIRSTNSSGTATFSELMRFTGAGRLKVGTVEIGTYESNVRYDCAVVLGNSYKSSLSLYITANGKTTAYENVKFNNWKGNKFNLVRFQMSANQTGSACFDNIHMYIGNEVVDSVEGAKLLPAIMPDEVVEIRLSGAMVLFDDSTRAYFEKAKIAPCSSLVRNGKVYVPARFAVEALGGVLEQSSDGNTVTAASDLASASFTLNDDYILSNGNILLEADKLFTIFGKKVTYSEKYGIIIAVPSDVSWSDSDVKAIYDYLTYTRPTSEQILKDFEPMKNVHPRILATAGDFERAKQRIKNDPLFKKWYSSAIQSADNLFGKDVTEYVQDNRSTILDKSRQVLSRVQYLGFAYHMTGYARYAERLWQELEAAGSFPDWNHKNHFLDTAEMTNAFAIGYDWCYDYWSDERREFLENAIITHGLNAGMKAYSGESGMSSSWVKAKHNWNEVCNGGMSVGALALLDVEPELCSEILELAFLSCESMLSEFAPDGAWGEGVGYWAYTVNYFAYHMSSLNSTLGTDYGYSDIRGISKTGYFTTTAKSGQGIFNFHDASVNYANTAAVFYLANRFDDSNLTKLRLAEMDAYKLSGGLLDLLWYEEPSENCTWHMDKDVLSRDTELATFRSGYFDTTALFAGLHGGYNLVNHGNLDVGTFVLDALGTRWAEDLGGDNYALHGYFSSSTRWNYYRMNAQGQNVIALDPITTPGQETEAFARFEKFETSERGGFAVLDTSSAYGEKVSYARRGIKTDTNRTQVLLQDEMNLTVASDLWWFMHTKATIDIASDGKSALLTIGSKKMKVILHSNVSSAVFENIAAMPLEGSVNPAGQDSNTGYRRLAVHVDGAEGEVIISVRFVPIANDVTAENAIYGTFELMSDWANESGSPARITGMTLGGKPVEGFASEKRDYSLYLPYGTKTPPELDVTVPDGFEAEITRAASVKDKSVIRVYDSSDYSNFAVYTVSFQVRTTVINEVTDTFESYSSVSKLSGTIWETSQVLQKAGPHTIRLAPGYGGTKSKSFGIVVPAGLTTGKDPALVTRAMDFTHPMKIKFDLMADSMDSVINVVMREGYNPNWIYPFVKPAGKTVANAFGIPIDGFEMENGKWYRFEYDFYAEPYENEMHFSLSVNGRKLMERECIECASDADFQSVKLKFVNNASDLATDTVTAYWDNISIERMEFMAKDISITSDSGKTYPVSQIEKGDVITVDISSVYEGTEALSVAFALYKKEGVLKQISYESFDASDKLSVSLKAESDAERGEYYKVFVWKKKNLIPLLH